MTKLRILGPEERVYWLFIMESLISLGHDVIALDSMFRGAESNLEAIIGHENTTCIKEMFEIDDLDACVEAMGGLDQVYHLAAVNGTKWFHEAAHSVIDVNINGTLRTLELAMAHDAKYVFASSPEAFGEPQSQPLTDGDAMIFSDPNDTNGIHMGVVNILAKLPASMRQETDLRWQ